MYYELPIESSGHASSSELENIVATTKWRGVMKRPERRWSRLQCGA